MMNHDICTNIKLEKNESCNQKKNCCEQKNSNNIRGKKIIYNVVM